MGRHSAVNRRSVDTSDRRTYKHVNKVRGNATTREAKRKTLARALQPSPSDRIVHAYFGKPGSRIMQVQKLSPAASRRKALKVGRAPVIGFGLNLGFVRTAKRTFTGKRKRLGFF